MEPYLQHGKVLISYETLHFQPRKKTRNICDVTLSNHHNSAMLHVKQFKPLITAKCLGKPQKNWGL